jgi:hypothetical protein
LGVAEEEFGFRRIAAMVTVDSQVKPIDAQDVESGLSDHMLDDIREQVNRLNDLIGSINEVYDDHKSGMVWFP